MTEQTQALTLDERRAIAGLQRLAKHWPKSLWLFSASGTLWIMKAGADGQFVEMPNGGFDQAYSVQSVDIPNDGGDWP